MREDLDLGGRHWCFALAFYGQSGVQDACLKLQDEAGLDIVFLIAALHAAMIGRPPSGSELAFAFAGICDWRKAAVLPLRMARRSLKVLHSDIPIAEREVLRNRIKTLELDAEQIELATLARRLRGDAPVAPKPVDRDQLLILIGEAFVAQGLEPPGGGLARAVATIVNAALAVRS